MTKVNSRLGFKENKDDGCVATIGNFDGLHLGHQAIIRLLKSRAEVVSLPACVILFEPHPQEYFLKKKAAARLMRLREKISSLQDLLVDKIICLRFSKQLALCSAQDFVKGFLVDQLGVRELIIGDDFHFGKGRMGDSQLLRELGKKYGFRVYSKKTVLFNGERVDSSRVRAALWAGDLVLASQLLSRPFMLSGRVTQGDQRGRLLGFPTANIPLHRHVTPLKGVFIVRVYGWRSTLFGIANCGCRPSFEGLTDILEVHLFRFNQFIYGYFLKVEFLRKIREERKFNSLEELKQQIRKDICFAKNYLCF